MLNKSFLSLFSFLIFSATILQSPAGWTWSHRGHASICEAAVFLLKEPVLKEYLQNRPQMMGHLCNVPDIYWKSLGPDVNKNGNPTHFINPDIVGLKIKDVPSDYKTILEKYTGTDNQFKKGAKIYSIPNEFGSIWWRADQFVKRAGNLAETFAKATPPANSKEEQDENLLFNKTALDFIINIGVLGHYVGDAAQPIHNTSDYDGYEAKHGGIHGYFEEICVGFLEADLVGQIVKTAKSFKKESFLIAPTTVEKMRALSLLSVQDIPKIYKLDVLVKPSEINKNSGMEIKTPAVRKDTSKTAQKMAPLITQEMARAASLLAQLWDTAYVNAGRPKFNLYKSYKYPFTPEFIAPDYVALENKTNLDNKNKAEVKKETEAPSVSK
jgi:hypothetical protein